MLRRYRSQITAFTVGAVALSIGALAPAISASASPAPASPAPAPAQASPASYRLSPYVSPWGAALNWVNANPSDPRTALIRSQVASQPQASWYVRDTDAQYVKGLIDASAAAHQVPTVVAYDLPKATCATPTPATGGYLSWITTFAAGIGSRPAVVVLEPGSLSFPACLTTAQVARQLAVIRSSVAVLRRLAPKATVYLDGAAGSDPSAIPVLADRLVQAGIGTTRGFVVDVAGYNATSTVSSYGTALVAALRTRGVNAHYLVDTSRNGNGANADPCNQANAKIGSRPDWTTGSAASDGTAWIKPPGESDGLCGVASNTPAGQFDPNLAYALASGSSASLTPSGQNMPVGNRPGWTQVVAQDFTQAVPVGGFTAAQNGSLTTAGSSGYSRYENSLTTYPDGWSDPGSMRYPSKVLSVENGYLNFDLHTETINGTPQALSAVVNPLLTNRSQGQTYGRYVTRFRADAVAGWGAVFLLWPTSNVWPLNGEMDFPEGDLAEPMGAFFHHANADGSKESFAINGGWSAWHTATIEWTPGLIKFWMDGVLVGSSTTDVPSQPMNYLLQSGSSTGTQPAANRSADIQVDWVAEYSYTP